MMRVEMEKEGWGAWENEMEAGGGPAPLRGCALNATAVDRGLPVNEAEKVPGNAERVRSLRSQRRHPV